MSGREDETHMRSDFPSSRFAGWLSAVLVVACTSLLAATPTVSMAVRLSTNALIMNGTGTPVPTQQFMETVINDFIAPTVPDSYDPVAVTTPEHVVGINQSVAGGVTALETAMAQNGCSEAGQSCVIFGYSQSTVITMIEKAKLQQRLAAGEDIPNVTFIGIGVGNRPNGGIAERLSGVTIPIADFTFNGPSPDTNSIPTIDIARQYDGLADTPEFLVNPIADLNAVLGVVFVHAKYADVVSFDPASPNYVGQLTPETHGDTTYYWIPTADLPLLDPLRALGVPEPVLDIVQPFLKVLVEAGYDRSVPFSTPTPAQMIPVIDPVTLSIELASATLEGANNAAKIVGAELPGYAALQQSLAAAQAWSATTIGGPYRTVVNAVNHAFNPFQIFASIEGPLARQFDRALDAVGISQVLGRIVNVPAPAQSASTNNKIVSAITGTASAPTVTTAKKSLRHAAAEPGKRSRSSQSPSHAQFRTHPRPTHTVRKPA
jgi:PE-PPE domain